MVVDVGAFVAHGPSETSPAPASPALPRWRCHCIDRGKTMHASLFRAVVAATALLASLSSMGWSGAVHAAPTSLDNDYPTCQSGEIYESPQPTNPGGVEPLGLCYSQCKAGYTGIGHHPQGHLRPHRRDAAAVQPRAGEHRRAVL